MSDVSLRSPIESGGVTHIATKDANAQPYSPPVITDRSLRRNPTLRDSSNTCAALDLVRSSHLLVQDLHLFFVRLIVGHQQGLQWQRDFILFINDQA